MILQHFNDPTTLVVSAIVMVFGLMFHNVVQALVAARFGDHGPRRSGFASFEPQQQLEPLGIGLLFLLGFGWPKIVPINGRNIRGKTRESLAWYSGPIAYLILGFASVLVGSVFLAMGSPELYRAFLIAASYAVLHAVINLFPVFPLDGAFAALAWGNRDVRRLIEQVRSYGLLGFILVFFVLSFTGVIGRLQSLFLTAFQAIVSVLPGL